MIGNTGPDKPEPVTSLGFLPRVQPQEPVATLRRPVMLLSVLSDHGERLKNDDSVAGSGFGGSWTATGGDGCGGGGSFLW